MSIQQILQETKRLLSHKLFDLGNTPITASTLLTMILIVVSSYIVSRLIRAAMRRALKARGVSAEAGGIGIVGHLLHYTLIVVGAGIALQTAGIELAALFAAGAVFAVGIGLAMQNVAQNFVSGIILMLERTIKPGDVIEVESTVVRVVQMGIRATIVRTLDDEDLIVPNATLVQSTVKNFTLRDSSYRIRVIVGVVYASDMSFVRRTLEQLAAAIAWRDTARSPRVLLVEFGSSSVDFEVSVWTQDPWNMRVHGSELREAIWQAFKTQGIVIAFPQLDLHLDPPVMESLKALEPAAAAMTS